MIRDSKQIIAQALVHLLKYFLLCRMKLMAPMNITITSEAPLTLPSSLFKTWKTLILSSTLAIYAMQMGIFLSGTSLLHRLSQLHQLFLTWLQGLSQFFFPLVLFTFFILYGDFRCIISVVTMSVTGQEVDPSMETRILEENVVCWLRQCSMSLLRTELISGMGNFSEQTLI